MLELLLVTFLIKTVFSLAWPSPDLEADRKSGYYVWSNSFLLREQKLSQVMGTGVCVVVDPGSPALSGE